MLGGIESLCVSCRHKIAFKRISNCAFVDVNPSTLKVMDLCKDISRAEGLSFYHPRKYGFAVIQFIDKMD